MNILFITHFLPPARNAGTENYTFGLAKELQARGHDVHVVCAGSWQTGDAYWNGVVEEIFEGLSVHRIQLNWTHADDPNSITYDSEIVEEWLARFLESIKPQVIHITSTMTLGLGTLWAPYRAGIPIVLTLMDFWFLCPRTVLVRGDGQLCNGITTAWECQSCLLASSHLYQRTRKLLPERHQPALWNAISKSTTLGRLRGARGMALNMEQRKALMKEALELPNVILSHSGTVQQLFAEADLSQRIVHLSNGHDMQWMSQYTEKRDAKTFRFGYMGQIREAKGIHVLVEAFQSLNLNGHARIDIWGDLTRDKKYVEQLQVIIGGDESIKLRGRFERNQLAEVLSGIDILVVPSLWYENAPLVIHEAFATKTPVIAANLGGMAEAVTHGVNGLLFEWGDVDNLANVLHRVVSDVELVDQLREGIGAVKTVSEEVSQLEDIYNMLVINN